MSMGNEQSVVLHNVNAFPPGNENRWCDGLDSLNEWDAERLGEAGVAEGWYWYGTGSYEGTGYLIARHADGRWASLYMGHCSCNGPTEDACSMQWHDSLDALQTYMSDELRSECAHLISAALAANGGTQG